MCVQILWILTEIMSKNRKKGRKTKTIFEKTMAVPSAMSDSLIKILTKTIAVPTYYVETAYNNFDENSGVPTTLSEQLITGTQNK